LGADIILPQIKQGVSKRRVGLLIEGAPAREHAKVFADGQEIGHVTSGCPSPTLKKNIAMAYVKSGHHKLGTGLQVMVRNKMINASVVKMPFVPAK
jgi:aminomethyltransferase